MPKLYLSPITDNVLTDKLQKSCPGLFFYRDPEGLYHWEFHGKDEMENIITTCEIDHHTLHDAIIDFTCQLFDECERELEERKSIIQESWY